MTTTECLAGVEILLFRASHVSKIPSSDLLSPGNITLEVTVDPEETSEAATKGRPDQNHLTRGLGRPEKHQKVCYILVCRPSKHKLNEKTFSWFIRCYLFYKIRKSQFFAPDVSTLGAW